MDNMEVSKNVLIAVAVVAILVVAGAAWALTRGGSDEGGSDIDDYSDDPILWIKGNVNGDHLITKADVKLIEKIVKAEGTYAKYPWADANNDKKITQADADYVQSMVDGKATKLYFKNIDGNIASHVVRDQIYAITVNKCQAEIATLLFNDNGKGVIVGGDNQCYKYNNELALSWDLDTAKKGSVYRVGVNHDAETEKISELEALYGNVALMAGSISRYAKAADAAFEGDDNVSIIRLPSWEDGTISGVMTYGYLFGGVQDNAIWKKALTYYDWYMGYYDKITEAVAKIPESERPKVLIAYTTDCFPGATNQILSKTSGDYEKSILCGANNIGDYFGTGYVNFDLDDLAACYQKYGGIDFFITEPSAVYDTKEPGDGKQAIIDALEIAVDELDGYIGTDTQFYALSFMVTAGCGCPVSFAFYASTLFPDDKVLGGFDVEDTFQEFLELMGWDDRTDVSDIVSYGPEHTVTPL